MCVCEVGVVRRGQRLFIRCHWMSLVGEESTCSVRKTQGVNQAVTLIDTHLPTYPHGQLDEQPERKMKDMWICMHLDVALVVLKELLGHHRVLPRVLPEHRLLRGISVVHGLVVSG